MFKTNAIDSVNNRYVDEDPAHGINGTRLIADDRNIVQDELTNAIERSGQTLDSSGDFTHNDQLATAMFINAVAAGAFVDNGSANTYQLTPLTGEDGLAMPEDYSQLAGATILFKPANANTGASTVEVGQTTSSLLPAKALLDLVGNPLVGGELSASNYYEIKYDPTADGGNGAWIILSEKKLPGDYEHWQENVLAGCQVHSYAAGDEDHDVMIERGFVVMRSSSSSIFKVFHLSSKIIKQIDAVWAEGNDAGGRASGVPLSADTMYYVFLIGKNDGTVDAGFDTDENAANLLADATGYTWYILLWGNLAVFTDGSSNLHPFNIDNNSFVRFKSTITEVNDSSLTNNTYENATMKVPPNSTGLFGFRGIIDIDTGGMNSVTLYAKAALETEIYISDVKADTVVSSTMRTGGIAPVRMDASRVLAYKMSYNGSTASANSFTIYNYGYYLQQIKPLS